VGSEYYKRRKKNGGQNGVAHRAEVEEKTNNLWACLSVKNSLVIFVVWLKQYRTGYLPDIVIPPTAQAEFFIKLKPQQKSDKWQVNAPPLYQCLEKVLPLSNYWMATSQFKPLFFDAAMHSISE